MSATWRLNIEVLAPLTVLWRHSVPFLVNGDVCDGLLRLHVVLAMGQVFHRVRRFSPVSIVSPFLHLLFFSIRVTVTVTSERNLGTDCLVALDVWEYWTAEYFKRCVVVGVRSVVEVSCVGGAQIHVVKWPWRWNFVRWLLVLVDLHCVMCIKSRRILRWPLEC
jgi:hypothetical protein